MKRTVLLTGAVLTLALLAGLVGFLPMPVAHAAVITVDSTADNLTAGDGACTLREAIMNANNNSDTTSGDCTGGTGSDIINLPAGTYTLALVNDQEDGNATGDLDITDDLTITGMGAATTIVAGNLTAQEGDRVFHILTSNGVPSLQQASPIVTMTGLTVRDGRLDVWYAYGGGILNEGDLTVRQVIVTSNIAHGNDGSPASGGGIYNFAALSVEDSTIADNQALGGHDQTGAYAAGGGIASGLQADLTGGRGITSRPDQPVVTVTIFGSTVSGNTAQAGDDSSVGNPAFGGGIALDGPTKSLIEYSTISGNTVQGGDFDGEAAGRVQQGEGGVGLGGGIYAGYPFTMTNSTISGNTAQGGAGPEPGEGGGGGLFFAGAVGSVSFCTFSQNTASTAGGGAYEGSLGEGDLLVKNTIIANNTAPSGPDIYGILQSRGWNLVENTSGGTLNTSPPNTGTGNITGVDPSLGPLALNAPGSTKTHALALGSAAIDTAEPACTDVGASTVIDDQRGVGRPIDGDVNGAAVCDIGAYEYEQYLDCGDAPDPTYPTLIASSGACHIRSDNAPGILGSLIDLELDGQPAVNADGDDLNDQDDEDGVTFTTGLMPGGTAGVDVVASIAGFLNAWIDFNADGDWADAGEQIFTDQPLVAGINSLSFAVPAASTSGPTFARFRYMQIDPQGQMSYEGVHFGGEVEDYPVTVLAALDLGDYVWNDTNQNGIQDTGEVGVPDITVDLYRRVCTGEAIASDTTDANGNYLFEDLQPGVYCLQFGNIPAGWSISPQDQGADPTVDSDADPSTAQIADINLQATDLDEDMGIYPLGALGDLVWYDTNQDGIQDTGEAGVQDITVDLYRRVCIGEAIASDITDANGNYLFENLAPGIYCLQFGNIPAGWSISPQNQGADDTVDSDADPVTAQITDINFKTTDLDEDMGLYAEGSVGDTVWCDADGGNDFDPGEGVAGVTVSLYDDPGCDGVAVNLLGTEATAGDGQYLFDSLPVGPEGDPVCYFATVDVAGMGACNVPITPIEYAVSLDTASPDDLDADFGFVEPPPEAASIGDFVWRDANVNGIQDAGEAGIGGVTVTLRDCEDKVLDTTTTTASGFYSFVDLDAGSYLLVFSAPGDHLFTLQNQGDDPALDSDADPVTGQTVCTTLAAGEDDLTWDAGLYEEIIVPEPPEIVPEASTLLLLGSAASGLAGYAGLQIRARRRKKK